MQTVVEPTEEANDVSETPLAKEKDAALQARADVAAKQDDVEAAREALQTATANRSSLKALICAGQMPADATAAAEQLEAAIQTARAAQGALIEAEHALAKSVAAAGSAESKLEWATARAAEAAAEAAAAEKDEEAHAAWKAALAEPPLATLPADAGAARQNEGAAALEYLRAAIPSALLEPAIARARGELERRDDLAEAAVEAAKAVAAKKAQGGGSALPEAERTYRAAEETLLTYVQTAPARLAAAVATFETIADSPPLTDAELARIREVGGLGVAAPPDETADGNDEPVEDEAKGGAGSSAGWHDADLDDASEGPDGAEQAGSAQQQQGGTEPAAEDQQRAAEPNDAWLATIPDKTFEQLAAYVAADADLESLERTDPDALVHAVDEAAEALTRAREEAAASAAELWDVEDAAAQAASLLAAEAGHEDVRLLSAARGDG